MKKTNKRSVIIIILMILVVSAAVCILCKPIYYRIYPFSRVSGTVELVIDGKNIALDEASFTSKGDKLTVTSSGDAAKIKMRANSYGRHSFTVKSGEMSTPIEISPYLPNSWDVMTFKAKISIDTSSGKAAVHIDHTDLDENYRRRSESVDLEGPLNDSELIRVEFGL